jgi:hypothetical protein
MVLGDDRASGELVICSAWGPDVDWMRNLRAGPATTVVVGRDRFVPEHRFLAEDEAVDVGSAFRAKHGLRMRLISAVLGWGDLRTEAAIRAFVRSHPFVAFRPTGS